MVIKFRPEIFSFPSTDLFQDGTGGHFRKNLRWALREPARSNQFHLALGFCVARVCPALSTPAVDFCF
jgi:hypothetical protein